jgi:cell division septation protein DedD
LVWGMIILAILVSGCASNLQTKVSGNLNNLSKDQTVAILPIETSHSGQKDMAEMFRQGLFANLKQSKFNLLEKYIVDGLLKQNDLDDPSGFLTINPMQFGEILGADAIVFSRINKVERNYFIVHSSIELSVSVQMIDTRTGEVLWRAEQTEHDFSGIGKIPTGIFTALFAPIQFVTNKFNLRKMTSSMVDKLTSLVKKPENAEENTKFEKPVIAKNASTDLKKIEELQQLKSEWTHALDLDEGIEDLKNEAHSTVEQQSLASPLPLEPMKKLQNDLPLKAVIRKVQAVEIEMMPLPIIPEMNQQPIPLNALKATLATSTGIEKGIKQSSENTKRVRSEPTPSEALYTVQVGAYKTKVYAQKLLDKLVKKGYNAFLVHNKMYRVRVDKFKNKNDALKLAQKIQEKEKLKNFVTLIKPT